MPVDDKQKDNLSPIDRAASEIKKSMDYYRDKSAMDLIKKAVAFETELKKHIYNQELTPNIISGILINMIVELATRDIKLIMDDKFYRFKKYVDENFVRKEKKEEKPKEGVKINVE